MLVYVAVKLDFVKAESPRGENVVRQVQAAVSGYERCVDAWPVVDVDGVSGADVAQHALQVEHQPHRVYALKGEESTRNVRKNMTAMLTLPISVFPENSWPRDHAHIPLPTESGQRGRSSFMWPKMTFQ